RKTSTSTSIPPSSPEPIVVVRPGAHHHRPHPPGRTTERPTGRAWPRPSNQRGVHEVTNHQSQLRVAMIGYSFMGRAHSQGWRVAPRSFDLPLDPQMAVLVGRDAE